MLKFIGIAIISILLIAIGIYLYFKSIQQLAKKPTTKVFHHTFNPIEAFDKENPNLESQSAAWRKRMKAYGELLHNQHVGLVIFSHGTFVGEDPLGITLILKEFLPRFSSRKQRAKIKAFNRSFWSMSLNDQANFHPDYVHVFEQSLQQDIPCLNFNWASGNYHAARLSGAINLIQLIRSKKKEIGNKRVLLIGHSHAGQVFSLASHLISKSSIGLEINKILHEEKMSVDEDLISLEDTPLDFVMLGTPYLYPWSGADKHRAIHLINHRNHPYLGGKRRGVFHTKDGDYIQQWGVAGSDHIASTQKERKLNKKLSAILGDTMNPLEWRKRISSRLRVPPYGETHLVDYLDSSQGLPNGIQTVFGHGVYTQYHAMLFNTDLICKALYEKAL